MKNLVIGMLLLSCFSLNAQKKGYEIGDKIENFSLENVSGEKVSLADYDGANGFIIAFTCNTCPVAQAYEGRLIALDNQFKEQGYPVIAINPNDPEAQEGEALEHMRQRATDQEFTFPYLYDPDHMVTKKFAPTRTPHMFVVQKVDNDMVLKYIGAIDDSQDGTPTNLFVENALTDLMQGKDPSTPTTKAIGCEIKWKKGTTSSL
ncbi:thioredoxin family protein [Olivibacter sp. SDN3]|uniref:thioredoxin family protein n=1 Tax=Olivibacter sp. SDN3 TaxID=2764720 RepID=UPI00165119FD|nr:thioredoxin family protein [Olivibacter sp. SDN3]QNL49591.1 thioredoxin family protein [Olivibacter sp. SDN3]